MPINQKHKIVKVKGRKPRKIFDREYRRMWYRKKYARFDDTQLLQQRTRWQKWAEKNNYKRPSQKGDTWYCVKRRAWARQQAVKAKWFRPIRKRLLINDKR